MMSDGLSRRGFVGGSVAAAVGLAAGLAGCSQKDGATKNGKKPAGGTGSKKPTGPQAKAELLVALPEYCNTPDGMALMPDNSIILSVPNFNKPEQPPLLVKITPDNKVEKFYELPTPHPDFKDGVNRMGPMGITYSPSGCLFLADMQMSPMKQNSRLWRLDLKDGKADKMVLVAKGFNISNGLAVRDGYVYVTESVLKGSPDSTPTAAKDGMVSPKRYKEPYLSAVMRFKVDEENVTLKTPLEEDPHIVTTFKSYKTQWPFGADGIAFDSKGNLFVGTFGDGILYKIEVGPDGKAKSNKEFAKADFMINCDGMSCCPKTDKLYVADSAANAIRIVNPDGRIETLAENDDITDKKTGLLDQPCEALVRGDTIVASNMDWKFPGFKNKEHQMPATLSVIKLK